MRTKFDFAPYFRNVGRSTVWVMLCLAVCMLGLTVSAAAQGGHFVTFDAPGAGTVSCQSTTPCQGTIPWGIVQGGAIMGDYIDANGVYHGFLRTPDGRIAEFEPPNAGTSAGQGSAEVFSMNPTLEIAGDYFDANNAYHGFLRTPDGKIITYDDPDAVSGAYMGTGVGSMNSAGVIECMYTDANGAWHGCLRAPDGTFTHFDPPDAGTGYYQGTYDAIFSGLTPQGAAVGSYLDSNYVWHGFLRAPDGAITEIDDPDAYTGAGTLTMSINPAGTIVGTYMDSEYAFHGFLRAPDGTITNFDVPGAGKGQYQGTNACWYVDCYFGITPDGTVTGMMVDASDVFHAYVRTPQGKFTVFDAPGAGRGLWQGTLPAAINPEGAITGYYVDWRGVSHGFLWLPTP